MLDIAFELTFVVRHCPVPKGLRLYIVKRLGNSFSRKTLPCSKGIETVHHTKENATEGRKTLPCSKGIETMGEQRRQSG